MKESTSCAAAVGCVPIGVFTGSAGGRRRRAIRSMDGHDGGGNPSRTNGQAEADDPSDRYVVSSPATLGDDRRRRLDEIEHSQV